MKKIGIIVGIIFAFLIAGMLFIHAKAQSTDVTEVRTRVGVILNGSCRDKSWGQSHYGAIQLTAKKLNLGVNYRENVPEDEQCMPVIEELISEGCEIIICNSFSYGEYELRVAKKHPEVFFLHATGTGVAKNFCSYFGRIYQMRYLSGVVAGLQTESDEIGYVAAFPISEVNRGINAFTLGAQSVNPEAVVHVVWTYDWNSDEQTEESANWLLDEYPQIDIVAMHTDSSKVLDVAKERGIWSIGYNMDRAEAYPKNFLTAPIWHWELFYEARILECLQGKFEGKYYWEDAASGIVALAPLTKNVKPGIAEVVDEEKKRLEDGSYDVFYGPIYDNAGILRVQEGENMSDDALLNHFDWYVKGVEVHER